MAEERHIDRGTVIAYVGSTGNADPAAPHLHFAVHRMAPGEPWHRGTPVNPYPLLVRDRPARVDQAERMRTSNAMMQSAPIAVSDQPGRLERVNAKATL